MKKNLRKMIFRFFPKLRIDQENANAYHALLSAKEVFPSEVIHPRNLSPLQYELLERGYEKERLWKGAIYPLLPFTMVTYDGLMSLVAMVEHLQRANIPGELIEAGTWRGGAAGVMAMAAKAFPGNARRIRLFDSFQGIPEPDPSHDSAQWITREMKIPINEAQGRLRSVGSLLAPRKDVEHVLFGICGYPEKLVVIHEGWFQETVPLAAQEIDRIAILRLDGDLYASTRICLEHLYDKLSPGGFLVIDDWWLEGAKKAVEEFLAKKTPLPFGCLADATVRYFIKP